MNDRQLLEAAAKAAGYKVEWHPGLHGVREMFWHAGHGEWNPLTDDGDALRLAVKRRIDIDHSDPFGVIAWCDGADFFESYAEQDMGSATRRAIVRAAAAIE